MGDSSMVDHFLSTGSTQLPPYHGLLSSGLALWLCLDPTQLCDGIPNCLQGGDKMDCGVDTVFLLGTVL